jgi:hypothetical protein
MTEIHEILAEYADGFLDGSVSVESLLTKYDIATDSELYHLLQLARELEESLVMVEPSAKYIRKLRKELTQEESDQLLRWLLHAPAVRVAAGIGGITVAAGIVWYAKRAGLDVKLRRDVLAGLTGKSDSSSVLVS